MKIFVELRKLLDWLGIRQNQKFNFENLFVLFSFVLCLVAADAFILFQPNTFVDLGNAFFESNSFFLNTFTLLSHVLKHNKIYILFEQFEETVEKRKSFISNIFQFLILKLIIFFFRIKYSCNALQKCE